MASTVNSVAGVRSSGQRRPGRGLLWAGSLGPAVFLGLGVGQGVLREGFDFRRNALSQLSLGELGWLQVAVFLVTGALVIVGAAGTRFVLPSGGAGRQAPWLVGVFGGSFLVSGVFRAGPGAGFPVGAPGTGAASLSVHGGVHMVGGMVGYLALCAAFLVLARVFGERGERGWAVACRVAPVVVLAGFMASAASVLAFTLGAGLGLAWLAAVTLRLAAAPAVNRSA